MAIIRGIHEAWQRDLVVRGGDPRHYRPVADARHLEGRRGTVADLRAMAQPLARKCYATIDIRGRNGIIETVTPDTSAC